jgi:hypothetical protein
VLLKRQNRDGERGLNAPGKSAALLACVVLLGGGALARAEVVAKGKLHVSVTGNLSPSALPRSGEAPIAVSLGGQVKMTDNSLPPQLRTLQIEVNRQGRFDHTGLPTCTYDQIQPASSTRALNACRSALVGDGSYMADTTFSGDESFPSQGRLLLFNGRSHGKPVLFGHIYSPRPLRTSFVVVFKIQRLAEGTYGTLLSASFSEALGKWGNLTGIEMTLSRRYVYRGERRSYVSASCPAPKGFSRASFPLMRSTFGFAGGTKLRSTLVRSCKAR